MPVMIFNDKDDLQHELLRRHGIEHGPAVVHQVPSSADFYAAIRAGLGWGMLPEPQARVDLAAGALVRLSGDAIDVPLYWQRWRLDSPKLAALTDRGPHRRRKAPAARVTARPATVGEAASCPAQHSAIRLRRKRRSGSVPASASASR